MSGILVILFVGIGGFLSMTSGETCTPVGNGMIVSKFKDSDVVVQGYPRYHMKQDSKAEMVVDFEVRCIFKGGPMDEMIRIYKVGVLDPQCNMIEYAKNTILLVYLKRVGDRLEASFMQDPGTVGYTDEILSVCGASVSYANGYSAEKNKGQCPEEDAEHDECQASAEEDLYTDSETPYQAVTSGDAGGNEGGDDDTSVEVDINKSVKDGPENPEHNSMGDSSGEEKEKSGEKSGDMKMGKKENVGATTGENKGTLCSSSWIMSLVGTVLAVGMICIL